MQDVLEVGYSPKRGTMLVIIAFFTLCAGALGYVVLTEEWTHGSTGILRLAAAASVLALICCAAFMAILLRSRNWRLRVDSEGVSIDTLFGRRSVAWADLQSAQMVGEGRTRGIAVTGTKGSFGINAMMMSDPSQLEGVFRVLQQRVELPVAHRSQRLST